MNFHVDKGSPLPGYRSYGIQSLSTPQLIHIYIAAKEAGTSDDFLELIQNTLQKRHDFKRTRSKRHSTC